MHVIGSSVHRGHNHLKDITEMNTLIESMGRYRLPNTRKYFEKVDRNINYKNLPLPELTHYLYNITKYNLISAYENHPAYILLQLKLQPLNEESFTKAGNLIQFSKTLFILSYFSLVNRSPTPIYEDYISNIVKYLDHNVEKITVGEIDDILLSLCMTDNLIRYGLIKNIWAKQFPGDIIELLIKTVMENKAKDIKSIKFEEFAKSYVLKTQQKTNLYFIEYVLNLFNVVRFSLFRKYLLF
jgi:hypothetical protein